MPHCSKHRSQNNIRRVVFKMDICLQQTARFVNPAPVPSHKLKNRNILFRDVLEDPVLLFTRKPLDRRLLHSNFGEVRKGGQALLIEIKEGVKLLHKTAQIVRGKSFGFEGGIEL